MAMTAILLVFSILLSAAVAVADDLQTLLSIKAAFFQHSAPDVFNSWQAAASPCTFEGITCNSAGVVIGMDLSNRNLTGLLPSATICQLKSLEALALGFNFLYGRVMDDLTNCSGLRYLDLGNNFFSGPFPNLSLLTGLVSLYANGSGFSGTFPWESLRSMPELSVLSLGDNPFDRTPFPEVIPSLTKLTWIYLSNSSIKGTIPDEIGNLVDLVNLELSQNYLTGEIPAGITRLRNLWQLELYKNDLTGELPHGLRNLTNLEFLDASANRLHGNLSEIRFMNKLKSIELYNNQLSGEVPFEIGEFKNLINLSLYINNLTGPLPQSLGSWSEFNYIDVSENFLTGPIPPNMCKKGTMLKLLILQNDFTGEIPASYSSCTTLIRFRVNRNRLTGRVPPGIWGLPDAEIIDVSDNDLEGPITSHIGNAKSLGQLNLASNRFSGELPREVGNASSLEMIDLTNNQFSGEVPATIGELKELTSLLLQGNNFSGPIPDSLGSCKSINAINMASNSLSGVIPVSLGYLRTLNFLNLSMNHLSGPIPDTLSSLTLNLLDLSKNMLSGAIPDSLVTQANNGSFAGNSALCSEKIHGFRQCHFSKSSVSSHHKTILFSLVAGFAALLTLLAAFCYLKKKGSRSAGERSLKDDSWDLKSFHVLTFSEDEILDSIKQENLIGKGGSGNVYRAVVGNGKEFAVKHIWHVDDNRKTASTTPMLVYRRSSKAREFEAEVETLSSVRHVNVVKLYCSIRSEDSSLLVYEYMPNGSLWDRLHTCNKLSFDWEARYEVALGAAKGLEYLHHGCGRPVIHRDVKSSNILLDEQLKPRIADFGLAKIIQGNSSKDSSHVITGTHGYIAPEYAYLSKVNQKSDVYSFGVVLMELVTGKRPIEPEYGEGKDIVDYVCGKMKTNESHVTSIVDVAITEAADRGNAIQLLKVGIFCTARNPSYRPTMRAVVQMIEDARPYRIIKDQFPGGHEIISNGFNTIRSSNVNHSTK